MNDSSRIVVCDCDAFYPFRSLVEGGLESADDLLRIEQFLRAVVLHDEIVMDSEPNAYDPESEPEWTDEEIRAGGRSVIVAYAPIDQYGIFSDRAALPRDAASVIALSPKLLRIAAEFSNAEEGNVFYKAHVEYIQRLFSVIEHVGSVLCEGAWEVMRSVLLRSSRWNFSTLWMTSGGNTPYKPRAGSLA